jgi:predicted ATPase
VAETAERAEQEIMLRLILGASLMTIKGYADPEVERVYLPARELCERQGASLQLFKVLWSLRLFYMYLGEMRAAREIAESLARQSESLGDAALMVEAHRAMGSSLVIVGEFAAALDHFERAAALYDPSRQDTYFLIHGNDAKVMSLCFAAWLSWCLGYPDRAVDRVGEAVSLARQISHAQSLVVALHFASRIHQLRREADASRRMAEEAIALAEEHGLEMWADISCIYLGRARVEQQEVEAGIEQMRAGLAAYRAMNAKLWRAYFIGLCAETLGGAGRIEEGLSMLAEAMATARETGECYYDAELHRIRGELLVMLGDGASGDEAEACFNEALAVARRQQARSWELKAAVSLARLYRRRGERAKARRLLAEICGWFTEGHNTADGRQARALLDDLR